MDAAGDGRRRTAAEGEAENPDGEGRRETGELLKCGLGIHFALYPIDATGAQAISGVVENQRGDTVGGQELLDGEPAADGLSNAVADENCRTRGAGGGFREYSVNDVFSAGNGMPGDRLIGKSAAWTDAEQIEGSVSQYQETYDAGQGKGEGSAMVGHWLGSCEWREPLGSLTTTLSTLALEACAAQPCAPRAQVCWKP